MILIFGGSYNGKLEFVKQKYDIRDEDIFFCRSENIDFSRKVICGIHVFVRECILNNIDSLDSIKSNVNFLKDKIIICDEINSGIVPLKKEDRLWREECGRALQYLSSECDECYRVFFGLAEKLK